MQKKTINLKDYQPYPFALLSVILNFDLYDDETIVAAKMHLKREHKGELRLYGDTLNLVAISVNDEPLNKDEYSLEVNDLVINNAPSELTVTIVTRIFPQKNTALSGLYHTQGLFCTQCEAEGFRRITYFPDRPDVLTKYTTRITANAEKYPVLLANGNLIDKGDFDDGRHWVMWEDPFQKPSYLFALVAGSLACVRDSFTTMSGREVAIELYVEHGDENKCTHAINSLKKAMRWDEDEYGREYDLDLYMIVAVHTFNMGAMENKGLNIFNAKYVLANCDSATDQDYADIESVIAHEYFHNWTGNRITCRDWFQLSLKEGLTVFRDQEFSRDMNSRDVNRIQDVNILQNIQFPEDSGAMAHPVRPESYQEINNFYTATVYNKGAEVIRMQQTILGREGFRRGMNLYFERHDGKAVTIDDFVKAMEDANNVDFSQFKLWYSQAGTPVIDVETKFKDKTLTLNFTQSCRPTAECTDKKPFHIPVNLCLLNKDGITHEKLVELREHQQTVEFEDLSERPIVSLLRDFSAPVIINIAQDDEDLLSILKLETNGYAKWQATRKIALNFIKEFIAKDSPLKLNEKYIDAYKSILTDDNLNLALIAELLSPPPFNEVLTSLQGHDIEVIENARNAYKISLSKALYDLANTIYTTLMAEEDNLIHAYARRKLRNVCLSLIMKAQEQDAIKLCQAQFKNAQNMTDKIASLNLLVNAKDEGASSDAIEYFYKQWAHDELVLDKWFQAQALADKKGALARVEKLINHPKFNWQNPNRVRSLISSFIQNPLHFHAIDGSGYKFLTETILKLDTINPQIASRFVVPFTRSNMLDDMRKQLIRENLELLKSKRLSADVSELVEKGLA